MPIFAQMNTQTMHTLFPNDEGKGFSQLVLVLNDTVRLLTSMRTVPKKDVKHWHLLEVARIHRACLATDPRDKLYAFWGLLASPGHDDVLVFTPDYEIIVQDLYRNFTQYFLLKHETCSRVLENCHGTNQIQGCHHGRQIGAQPSLSQA